MSEKTKKYIKAVGGTLLSLLLVTTGVLLVAACISVYQMGDRPFTVQNMSAAFSKICVPVYITLGATLAGLVVKLFFPPNASKPKASVSKRKTISTLEGRLDKSSLAPDVLNKIKNEKTCRAIFLAATVALCAALSVPTLIYAFDPQSYTLDYNGVVIALCVRLLPATLIGMTLVVLCMHLCSKSLERQITLLKAAVSTSGGKVVSHVSAKRADGKIWHRVMLALRIVLLAVALLFIIEGISNGGVSDVLMKAVNICTECIGLG